MRYVKLVVVLTALAILVGSVARLIAWMLTPAFRSIAASQQFLSFERWFVSLHDWHITAFVILIGVPIFSALGFYRREKGSQRSSRRR